MSADNTGRPLAVFARESASLYASCFALGRVDGDRFMPLPGFPSPSSSGISGQQAAAW